MNTAAKKTTILCLTATGARLGLHLAKELGECEVYLPKRLAMADETMAIVYFTDWHEALHEAFTNSSHLICIMAAGIVVRSLAPWLVSKYHDPAVVVMDEKGQYVISLLSGHIGGANQLAIEVAALMGGQAVITTATDVAEQPAVDLLAQQISAVMSPLERIKTLNRYLAEGKPVNLYSPWPLIPEISQDFTRQVWPFTNINSKSVIIEQFPVCTSSLKEPALIINIQNLKLEGNREWVQLQPRNLVVGIGCRKDVSIAEVQSAFNQVMVQYSLNEECVQKLATIDIKAKEPALLELAQKLKIPLVTFNKEQIRTLDGYYQPSERVSEKIGVGGVCEPAALLATGQGIMLVPKQKIGPVTISVAMEKSWWWDWDLVNGIC